MIFYDFFVKKGIVNTVPNLIYMNKERLLTIYMLPLTCKYRKASSCNILGPFTLSTKCLVYIMA